MGSLAFSLPSCHMKRSPSHSVAPRDEPQAAEEILQNRLNAVIATAPQDEQAHFRAEMHEFSELFSTFINNTGNKPIVWDKIKPPPPEMILSHKEILSGRSTEQTRELLNKLVVLKLNGGLGTSMGCVGPKSAIEVHYGYTFLDLTVRQIESLNQHYGTNIPLVLMNSFNTDTETAKILHKYDDSKVDIRTFNQHRFPRIYKDTLEPACTNYSGNLGEWYPPGHGDVFPAFYSSDAFTELINQGKQYVFISNIDNLGATVDPDILGHMVETESEYIMEVTDKTRADVKGGTLIEYEGKAKLLEIAQVPPANVEEFKSVKKFKIFNTNNLWVSMPAIKEKVESRVLTTMDIIVNNKDYNGRSVIQLERAAGAAIQYFSNAHGVNVPRKRFLPVKDTSDLFVVQSNLYTLRSGSLIMNPARPFETVPLVKLGDQFKKVSSYQSRFATIPDILELDHLTVAGDVTFGSKVTLRGTVIIVANHGERIDIASGSILENKVVSGNLRILDH